MILKEYQITAVDKLLSISKKLLQKNGVKQCVVKAPTGSGKTIMIAEWLNLLAREQLNKQYSFIWISGNKLHQQSKEKLQSYLADTRYTFSLLEDITENKFQENEVIFVNWHSLTKQDKETGKYTNVFMRDNEGDKNLQTFVAETKEEGREIILIVDESHYHYWSEKSQELVQTIIAPKLILEVSATPSINPTPEQLEYEDAGQITVRFEDVVSEGMIKKEVVINAEIGTYKGSLLVADDVVLLAALERRDQLKKLYHQKGININPLLLIQLPSEGEKTSALDESKMEQVIKVLKDQHNITIENNRLGIWLSEEKENLKNIESKDNTVDVLIFKQAIALGWDCPRAQILVMFREIKSTTFEVQTVGRILRMPEAKHYDQLELDRAYVYTNIDKLAIKQDNDSKGLFHVFASHRKESYENIQLPSIYLKRIDYGDLTLKFRTLFIQEANNYFGIHKSDTPEIARNKADVKLELELSELTKPVIVDVLFTNIDVKANDDIIGTQVHFSVSEDEIKNRYETFAKLASLPYSPVRSCNKVQMALYDWFDSCLGYKTNSRLDIQRIVVCSTNNQKIFHEIIERAKEKFKVERTTEINRANRKKEYLWDVPVVEYFNENFTSFNADNYAHDKCYVYTNRSKPEQDFEEIISKNSKLKWWYKNGIEKETCFAVDYIDPNTGIQRAFYPDYIAYYDDGTIGIYDTKSGYTAESEETKAKSNALQSYITDQKDKGRKIRGGIVQHNKSGLFVCESPKYNSNMIDESWKRLDI
ncbi:MAG: DEAD/DEAH box helicase family protein [Candidatus Roizmanbacteria bacterium]